MKCWTLESHLYMQISSGPQWDPLRIPLPHESLKIWEWYGKLAITGSHYRGSLKIPLIYGLGCTCFFVLWVKTSILRIVLINDWCMLHATLHAPILTWVNETHCPGSPEFLAILPFSQALQRRKKHVSKAHGYTAGNSQTPWKITKLTMVISCSHPPKKGPQRRTQYIRFHYNDHTMILFFCDQWSSACEWRMFFFSTWRWLLQIYYLNRIRVWYDYLDLVGFHGKWR